MCFKSCKILYYSFIRCLTWYACKGLLNQYIYLSFQKHYITNCFTIYAICRYTKYLFLFIFRHNDLPWNIRKFVHNKLDTVNFTHNLKYIDPWAKSRWSHTDIGRMVGGQIGCQVSLNTIQLNVHFSQREKKFEIYNADLYY